MHESAIPDIEQALGHEPFLRNLARSLVRGDDQVDDLVQEAYVATLEGSPPPQGNLRGWLVGVMRRRAVGTWRRRGVEARHETRVARPTEVPSVADVHAREEMRRAVVSSLLRVAEPSRTTLLLRYYEGLPPREIAARLGVPVETVRTRTKRGLAAMRTDLDTRHGGRSAWSAPLMASLGMGSATVATLPAWGLGLLVAVFGGAVLLTSSLFGPAKDDTSWDGIPGEEVVENHGVDADHGPTLEGTGPVEVAALVHGTAAITGRVLREGQAVAATVSLRKLPDADYAWNAIDGDFAALRMPPARRAQASAGGAFVLADLPVGWFLLTAETAGMPPLGRLVHVATDGIVADGTLLMPKGTETLRVEVNLGDGHPYQGTLRVSQRDNEKGDATHGDQYVETDARGGVEVANLVRGACSVSARTPGGDLVLRVLSLPVEGTQRISLVRPASPRAVEVVEAGTGRGVAGATVTCSVSEYEGSSSVVERALAWRLTRAAATGDTGRLVLSVPTGDEAYIGARAHGYRPGGVRVPAEGPVRIELERNRSVAGRVIRADGGEGVRQASVYARMVRNGRLQYETIGPATTDAEGSFVLEGVQPGEAMIYALADGFCTPQLADAREQGFNPCLHTIPPDGLRGLALPLEPAATLRGRVVDAEGTAIQGLEVDVRLPGWWDHDDLPHRLFRGPPTVVTDADGRFEVTCVPQASPGWSWPRDPPSSRRDPSS
ncbi:MAG: sigma-70 family RNA polymerase sigma factor [Planctomycetota bacterium]